MGNRFEIEHKTVRTLKAIPTDDFSACFEDWRKRWHKCIVVGADYFMRDDVDLEE